MVVVPPRHCPRFRRQVVEQDADQFILIARVTELRGNRFLRVVEPCIGNAKQHAILIRSSLSNQSRQSFWLDAAITCRI